MGECGTKLKCIFSVRDYSPALIFFQDFQTAILYILVSFNSCSPSEGQSNHGLNQTSPCLILNLLNNNSSTHTPQVKT